MTFNRMGTQLKNLFVNLSPARRIVLLSLLGGTIIALVFVLTWSGRPDFKPLYSNLAPEDAGMIVNHLKAHDIAYRVGGDGRTVEVPAHQLYETRMALAAQGMPQGSGVGFEIFDNTKLGMTEFTQNVNYQRALQGELTRTINRFEEVDSSRVHLVMPARSLFIEEEQPARASVVLKLHPGRQLRAEQVQAVVHLLATAVPGLSPDDVTVVDSFGHMLAGRRAGSPLDDAGSEQLAYQESIERSLETRLKSMLDAALGPGKAIVRLACQVDFRRQERTEERYLTDNRVVRSEQQRSESRQTGDAAMGVPGIAGPALNRGDAVTGGGDDASQLTRQDRTVNYEIGRVTSRTVEPVGSLQRVSVAVLVDGSYTETVDEDGNPVVTYAARSEDEMAKLESVVKRAVNFDPARGDTVELVNIAFHQTDPQQRSAPGRLTRWRDQLAGNAALIRIGLAVLFVLMTWLTVIRPLVRWLTAGSLAGGELLQQLPKTVDEIEREFRGDGIDAGFREQITQLITNDSQGSLALMRDMIKE